MNPYLEAQWSNVQVLMMGAITAALNRSLPQGLEARPEEDIRVESIAGERLRGYRADVAVVDVGLTEPVVESSSVAVAEPIRIAYHRGPLILRNVQIVDTRNHDRVVTAIEVLSPWNKLPGKLNRDYVSKLQDFERAGTNWVEIDLLRSPRDRLLVTWDDLPAKRRGHYLVLTYRATDAEMLAYPVTLRQKLPVIHIPLREVAEQVDLDLQAVMDRVYSDGPFGAIDYTKPPKPPLDESDSGWVEMLLRAES